MAHNTRLTPYGEQTVGPLDEPEGGPEFMAYGSTPPMAKRDYFLPEGIPLFLSNDAAEAKPQDFDSGGERSFDRTVVSSRVLKASILVASAAAIALVILSVENPLALFANAKASLIGVQPGTTAKSAPEPVVAARPAAS